MQGAYRQIGEVSQLTGLSLNTIRRYEDLGLLSSMRRSRGGFRLYDDDDVARLQLLQDMRPLEFTVEEKRALLGTLDRLADAPLGQQRAVLADRLRMYRHAVQQRIDALHDQVSAAETFASALTRYAHPSGTRRNVTKAPGDSAKDDGQGEQPGRDDR